MQGQGSAGEASHVIGKAAAAAALGDQACIRRQAAQQGMAAMQRQEGAHLALGAGRAGAWSAAGRMRHVPAQPARCACVSRDKGEPLSCWRQGLGAAYRER